MDLRHVTGLMAVMTLMLMPLATTAHGPVERKPEITDASIRLFTADAATGELVIVDMPSGDVIARLTTPRYIMSLGLSNDRGHLFVMRGRNTDRDMVTVVNTGF